MKAAILIDGGYFLKRLGSVRRDIDMLDAKAVDTAIGQLVDSHLKQLNHVEKAKNHYSLLYRCFFYDALPYMQKAHLPVSKRGFDYAKSDQAQFRLALFDRLRRRANFAVRLGQVRLERSWILSEEAQKAILNGTRQPADLTDADFYPGLRQKAVDMRIGVDIASISLKRQADTIILIAGDSDFVPASKLARREGVRIVLDPMWQSVEASLFEHIDALRSGFARPGAAAAANPVPSDPAE
ncbi:NYN domain-containing protein [Tabrizicola flagellatus]|uniref:NYN domain-containing protein n=1 Tax=Tabrizicola flagellatus TaxID=2593021 RepID=UPI00190F26D0|nr:NYN domain-containing protein [Tabrizicola flagellatus]